MKGKKALAILEHFWGKEIADAFFRGQKVQYQAPNGMIYQIQSVEGFNGNPKVKVTNLTLGLNYCIHPQNEWNNPMGDNVLTLLEFLRLRPEEVERKAGKTLQNGLTIRGAATNLSMSERIQRLGDQIVREGCITVRIGE